MREREVIVTVYLRITSPKLGASVSGVAVWSFMEPENMLHDGGSNILFGQHAFSNMEKHSWREFPESHTRFLNDMT